MYRGYSLKQENFPSQWIFIFTRKTIASRAHCNYKLEKALLSHTYCQYRYSNSIRFSLTLSSLLPNKATYLCLPYWFCCCYVREIILFRHNLPSPSTYTRFLYLIQLSLPKDVIKCSLCGLSFLHSSPTLNRTGLQARKEWMERK